MFRTFVNEVFALKARRKPARGCLVIEATPGIESVGFACSPVAAIKPHHVDNNQWRAARIIQTQGRDPSSQVVECFHSVLPGVSVVLLSKIWLRKMERPVPRHRRRWMHRPVRRISDATLVFQTIRSSGSREDPADFEYRSRLNDECRHALLRCRLLSRNG